MKELKHENVMELIEIHESKNSIYLVLELLQGGELFNHINSKKSMSMKAVHRIMKCIFKGLAYLAK